MAPCPQKKSSTLVCATAFLLPVPAAGVGIHDHEFSIVITHCDTRVTVVAFTHMRDELELGIALLSAGSRTSPSSSSSERRW